MQMHKSIPALVSAVAFAAPATGAWAAAAQKATPRKRVATVTKTVVGPQVQADRWGYLQVALVVKKTTTTTGAKKKVTRKIIGVSVPVYPNHTDRSVYINQQAIPLLRQEVLQAQLNPNIDLISGASASSDAFIQSLQAAILQAKKV